MIVNAGAEVQKKIMERYQIHDVASSNNAALSITHVTTSLLFNPIRKSGDWALLKLMDEGKVSGSIINWTFTAIGQKQTATIGYEISGSGAEFIRSGHFSRFRCPSTVCP